MAGLISEILQAREPDFSQKITELEKLAGQPGIDIRLIGELIQRHKKALNSLGLDSKDTTANEFYYSLIRRAVDDSKKLAQDIGVVPEDSPEDVIKKCIGYTKKTVGRLSIWTLKSVVAKKQLKDNPPKKLMKAFSLRSIDSALKREPLSPVFVFAKKTETNKWFDLYIAQASKMSASDFDYQEMEISLISDLRQSQLRKAGLSLKQIVYINDDIAGLVIVTPEKRFAGDVLYFVNAMLENIRLLKLQSLYLKKHSLEPDFSQNLGLIRQHGFAKVARRHMSYGWNAYIRNLVQSNDPYSGLDIYKPEDFSNIRIHDLLGSDSIWQHHYLVARDGKLLISCNLSDVIINIVNQRQPEQSHYYYAQNELFDELFSRYLGVPEVRQYLYSEDELNG